LVFHAKTGSLDQPTKKSCRGAEREEKSMSMTRFIVRGLVIAAILLGVYYYFVANMAVVELNAVTNKRTVFKIYYRTADKGWTEFRSSAVVIRPGQTKYFFRLTNLTHLAQLRIDTSEKPATVTVHSLILRQPGYKPVPIDTPEQFNLLQQLGGIAELTIEDSGFTVKPANNDPRLTYTMAPLTRVERMQEEAFRISALVLLSVFLAWLSFLLAEDFQGIPVLFVPAILLALIMAGLSLHNCHPDEEVHIAAARYYVSHNLPPRVDDPAIAGTFSPYGVSRLNSGEIAYFFIGKFVWLLEPLQLPDDFPFRLFNVLLMVALAFLALRFVPYRILLIPLLLSPQIWYIFSYCNSEGFAVFIMSLVAYQAAVENSAWNRMLNDPFGKGTLLAVPFLGLLLGMLLLVKINFYFFGLFLFMYLLWRLFYLHTILDRPAIMRGVAVILVALAVFGAVRGLDAWINDFNKKEMVMEAREKYADKIFKPSTPLEKKFSFLQKKDRGYTIADMLIQDRWLERVFRSSFGEYGFMTVSGSFGYYDCVRYAGLLLFLVAGVTIVVMGRMQGASLIAITLVSAIGLLAASLYNAWTADYQSQGRYLLPILGMLGVLFYHQKEAIKQLPVMLLVCTMYALSIYSYIFIALAGISKVGYALG
jgi:hypothetical protein